MVASTLTLADAKKLKPGSLCRPPLGTYLELKLLVNTFCALLWTLFGSSCDYYCSLMEVRHTLDSRDVAAIRDAFNESQLPHARRLRISQRSGMAAHFYVGHMF